MKPVTSSTALADGESMACRVDGVSVLLCRVDGRHYAVANRCSHASQPLDEGRLQGTELTCPLHGARFDVRDGACLAAPAVRPLRSFPVVERDGQVWVEVADADRPARPRFGPLY